MATIHVQDPVAGAHDELQVVGDHEDRPPLPQVQAQQRVRLEHQERNLERCGAGGIPVQSVAIEITPELLARFLDKE